MLTKEEWKTTEEGKSAILHDQLYDAMQTIARAIVDRKVTTSIRFIDDHEGLAMVIHGQRYMLRKEKLDAVVSNDWLTGESC